MLSTQREERGEVGIGGHEDSVLPLGERKHDFITGGLHADVADMDCIVSCPTQTGSNARRDRVVNEEPQEAALIGISRSRTLSAA